MKRHRKIGPDQSPNNYSPRYYQSLSNQSQAETRTPIEDVFEEQDAGNATYGPECYEQNDVYEEQDAGNATYGPECCEQNDVYEEYSSSSLLYGRCRLMTHDEKLSWKYDKSKYSISNFDTRMYNCAYLHAFISYIRHTARITFSSAIRIISCR